MYYCNTFPSSTWNELLRDLERGHLNLALALDGGITALPDCACPLPYCTDECKERAEQHANFENTARDIASNHHRHHFNPEGE